MKNQSRKSRTLVGLALFVTACGGCRPEATRTNAPAITAAPDRNTTTAMARPTTSSTTVADYVPSTPPTRKHPVTMVARKRAPTPKFEAPTTEVFGLRAAPIAPAHKPPVLVLTPIVVNGTPAPKAKTTARSPTMPPSAAAQLAIEESHGEMSDFRLVDVQYFLNGKELEVERDNFLQTASVFDGATRAGINMLVVRATARGVGKFPFLYLNDLVFTSERVETFTASAGDRVTVGVIASSDGDLAKQMKDRLHVNVGLSIVPSPKQPQIGWR